MNKHIVPIIIWSVFLAGSLAGVMFSAVEGVKVFFGFAAFVLVFALYDSVERMQKSN